MHHFYTCVDICSLISKNKHHYIHTDIDVNVVSLSLLQDVANKWTEVKQLVPKRDSTLQHEMVRQQNNERMRRQFAEKANMVGQWVERHLDAVASISVQKGSLEDHRNR